jgi:hypothetical protein
MVSSAEIYRTKVLDAVGRGVAQAEGPPRYVDRGDGRVKVPLVKYEKLMGRRGKKFTGPFVSPKRSGQGTFCNSRYGKGELADLIRFGYVRILVDEDERIIAFDLNHKDGSRWGPAFSMRGVLSKHFDWHEGEVVPDMELFMHEGYPSVKVPPKEEW